MDLLAGIIGDKIFRAAPGLTYGPAVSRISRTPIRINPNQTQSGLFDPESGVISINPNGGMEYGNTVRHESIHALLSKLKNPEIGQTIPGFNEIAPALKNVGGTISHEVPAYMGAAPNSQFIGVSDKQRNDYVTGLVNAVQKLDPEIGKRLARLTGVSK